MYGLERAGGVIKGQGRGAEITARQKEMEERRRGSETAAKRFQRKQGAFWRVRSQYLMLLNYLIVGGLDCMRQKLR